MFEKKEWVYFFISVFFLSFFFGFDDGSKVFNAVSWVNNLVQIFFIVLFSYGFYVWFQRKIAYKQGIKAEFDLWWVKRLWFAQRARMKNLPKIYIGLIMGLIFTVFSYGKIVFTAVASPLLKEIPSLRTGRKFKRITDYETALIYFSGPLAAIILVILFGWLKKFGFETDTLIYVNLMIALWNMVPFPGVDGNKILFSSRTVYVFGVLLLLLAWALSFINIIGGVILSILIAGIIAGIYHYKWEG